MDSQQTLHDFVLDLLTNPDARSAFDLDPEGALRGAGLTDITAADVQDVVPLVVDYAPGAGLAPLASPVGQLGLDPLLTDTTDVVGQLQSVAQQISVTSSPSGVDVKAGVLGAIAVDPSTAAAGVTVLPGIGLGVGPSGLDTDLAGVSDVAHTLDADVVQPVDAIADPVLGDVTSTVGDPTGLLDVTDSNLIGGDLTGGALSGTHGQLGGVVSSLGVDDTLNGLGLGHGDGVVGGVPPLDVPSTVGGVTHQVDSLLPGVTDTVGDVTGGVTDGVLGGDSHASSDHGLLGITGGLL
ncbi:IniB N-terminal domain-containing protein [Micromonospora sp. M51]|uniref:IniB N-terminal domain-containing protein n=1 Tax=Micromonospora TaxID=1873 RepID=UPI0004C27261|nr:MULTISPECIES: IniB N-terminal domain-containing protein [Micromonospora]MBQ1013154.1 IniB N-terminal domain-containing protein [Micromonospora sp. M51]MBQ1028563.1 IniB N-terminal domain-containing protein [Micromonospora sp. C97]